MAPNAYFVMAVWTLTGMVFGLLSTGYGACRRTYRFFVGVGEFLDWFWFVLAAAVYLVMIFWTEWGTFRIWSIGFILLGYGLWSWLAAPTMLQIFLWVGHGQARAVHMALAPWRRTLRLVTWVARKLAERNPPPKR